MAHILKNNHLEIHIDLPHENYNLSRFDWTGKITEVKYKDKYLTGMEIANSDKDIFCGKGLYNEFGINSPIGYDETQIGDWFHKIGVGLLKREDEQYNFFKPYKMKPSEFSVIEGPEKIRIICRSQNINGYSYLLEKEIELRESGFEIRYYLENTGKKTIETNEYNHNFLSIDGELIGRDYLLKFPFQLKPSKFDENVNLEGMVDIGQKKITFINNPQKQFFFSNLSGGETVEANWELINMKSKIGISETGNFQTNLVNLWGWGHVVSPELFLDIIIPKGQSKEWARTYNVYEIG